MCSWLPLQFFERMEMFAREAMRKQAALSERIRREVQLTECVVVALSLHHTPPPPLPRWCRLQRSVSVAWPCSTDCHSLDKRQRWQGWLVRRESQVTMAWDTTFGALVYVMLLLLCQTSVSRPCLCPRPLATPTHHEPISISTPVVSM